MNPLSVPGRQTFGLFSTAGKVYRQILAHSSEAIAIVDLNGQYLEQNEAHRELIGFSDEELAQQSPAIHLGEEGFAAIVEELERTGRYAGEVTTHTKDGRALILDLSAFAVRNERGEPICYVGIKRDITARKQVEREQRQRYDQLQILYRITEAVGRASGVEEIYEEALTGLERSIGAKRASILLFDADGVMRFKAWRGISERYRRAVEGHSPWTVDAVDPTPIAIEDAAAEEGLGEIRDTILAEGIRALGFFPLVARGRLVGKFMVYYDAPHTFSGDAIQLAQTIANHVAFGILKKRDEQELRLRQALLTAQQEASIEGILLVSTDRRIISFNRRFAEMWGVPAELLAQQSAEEVTSAMVGKVAHPHQFAARIAELDSRPEESSREEILLRDGRTFERYAAPIQSQDWHLHGRIWFFRDVTTLKRGEEIQRFLAEAGNVLAASLEEQATLIRLAGLTIPFLADYCLIDVIEADGDLRRIATAHVNPEKAPLLEKLRRYPPRSRAARHPVIKAVRTGLSQFEEELGEETLRRIAANGRHLRLLEQLQPCSWMTVPMIARGRTLGAITLVMAESGRRYAAQDLTLAEELARRAALAVDNARLYEAATTANRAKADFLAVMSHELRTPLNAILGYTELLEMGVPQPLPADSRRPVERIGASARHLLQIIEQILAFSRLDAGREEVHASDIDVVELARDAAALIQPLGEQKGLAFTLSLPPRSVVVQTDPGKLRQILLNLLSNAIKFTEAGAVGLVLEDGRDRVTIQVQDSGVGIPPAQLELIFEPFWQGDRVLTRSVGGTGLGLSVTRQLTELLGGEVRVESHPGRGSTFTLQLPKAVRHSTLKAANPGSAGGGQSMS